MNNNVTKLQQIDFNKSKTPFYKKGWFWFIIVIVAIMIFCVSLAYSKNDSSEQTQQTTVNSQKGKISESEYKSNCQSIDYDTLARNPEKYKGNDYKLTGKVIQTVESSVYDTVDLRIDITQNENSWTDTIYATVKIPKGNDRILEDDIITFWGRCDGLYSYTSSLKSKVSLPKIDIRYFEVNQ